MAFANLAAFRTALSGAQKLDFTKQATALTNPRFGLIYDQWQTAGLPVSGSVSTVGNNGVIINKSTTGAFQFSSAGSGNTLYLASVNAQTIWDTRAATQYNPIASGLLHVWDRIWYNDALSSNTTARRSWTPPALTRYTSGDGLSIWFRQTASGTGLGVVTYTLEYTNQSGVATSVQFTWNHANYIAVVSSMFPVPLALGDTGVREVTAVTQSATVTSGQYGFCIQKYLGAYPIDIVSAYPSENSLFCGMPAIDNDAHLCLGLQIGAPVNSSAFVSSTTPAILGQLQMIEG